jgi:DNA-binding response OmpR family regulator
MVKSYSASNATILLLDSEPSMRAVLRDALQDAGYLVAPAGDISEAVDRLIEVRPDLLITRPYINSMSGRMAADYLRTKQHGLPVLVVSGFLDDDRPNIRNAVGEFHTFPKPFGRDEFLAKVTEVLAFVRKS